MRKQIRLNIPIPCHESWDKMVTAENGKFCNSCQKQVIDFTNMSDSQLVAFFRKPATGSVCGRFMQDQLDRSMEIPKKRIPWVKYFFQFALPAFLASSKAASQGQVRLLTGDTVVVTSFGAKDTRDVLARRMDKRIKGKIVDESGNGIPYASVFIKDTILGTATDSTGRFSLEFRSLEDSIVLMCSSVGFQPAEIVLILNKYEEDLTIRLKKMDALKEVVVSSSIETRDRVVVGAMGVVTRVKIFELIPNKVLPAKQSFKVYPNPISRNNSLTIEIAKSEGGNHLFQVLAMNGQIVLMKEYWIDKSNSTIKLDIASMATGTYFLRMVNKRSGKQITEKIIVE